MAIHCRPLDVAATRGRPLATVARSALAGVAASAVIGVVACGNAVPGDAGHLASSAAGHAKEPTAAVRAATGVPLCAAADRVDRVVVSLTSALARHFHEILPRTITISDAPEARALATAVCALPRTPPGLRCPADFGGSLRMKFSAGRRDFRPVGIQISGCRGVTGAGPARSWSRSPQFGRLLIRTLAGRGAPIPGKSSVPTP